MRKNRRTKHRDLHNQSLKKHVNSPLRECRHQFSFSYLNIMNMVCQYCDWCPQSNHPQLRSDAFNNSDMLNQHCIYGKIYIHATRDYSMYILSVFALNKWQEIATSSDRWFCLFVASKRSTPKMRNSEDYVCGSTKCLVQYKSFWESDDD